VLAAPGALKPAMRLDCHVEILDDAPVLVEQNHEVIVFIGTDEVPAQVTLLDRERIGPGEEGWVQLRLARPVAALRGDRLILRRPSPAITIGGGVVVDPSPPRHKQFQGEVIASLEVMEKGTPEDLVLQELGERGMEVSGIARATGVEGAVDIVRSMVEAGDLVWLGSADAGELSSRSVVMRAAVVDRLAVIASDTLERFHARRPLEGGMRRDEFRAALGGHDQRVFDELARELERRGVIRSEGAVVARPAFRIQLDASQRQAADAFLAAARANPYAPPAPEAFGLTDGLVLALEATGELVRVADQIAYPADVFDRIRDSVLSKLERDTTITLAEYRDLFGTSRKYAQPTLEYLDERRITRRKGDVRVRYRGAGAGG
jgi:selenocysteine-specific elongation factor